MSEFRGRCKRCHRPIPHDDAFGYHGNYIFCHPDDTSLHDCYEVVSRIMAGYTSADSSLIAVHNQLLESLVMMYRNPMYRRELSRNRHPGNWIGRFQTGFEAPRTDADDRPPSTGDASNGLN